MLILNFNVITLEDKATFEKYNINNPRSAYNFTTNFIWSGEDKLKICVEDDFLFILWDIGTHSRMLYPKGFGSDKKSAVLKACQFMQEKGLTPKFVHLSEDDVLEMKGFFGDEFLFDFDRDGSDYIYETQRLISLSGKKLHSKKNHLNSFKRNHDFTYRRIETQDIPKCKALFELWYNDKEEITRLMPESRAATYKLLDNIENLGLVGGLIEIDGKVVACTVGEKVTQDTALIHVEFADTSYGGTYAAINQQFAEHEWSDTSFTNREEDMGNEGLRKAKESYQPIKLLNSYTAILRK